LNRKLTVKKNNTIPFRFVVNLILVVLFGALSPTWGQPPQHLQSFTINPLEKGDFFLFSKKPQDALKVFQDLWQSEPQNNYAVRGIVRSHQALGTLPEGVSSLNGYLEKHPQSSSASYGLGYIFYLQGKFKESEKVLNEALGFDPKNTLVLNTLAAVLAELKDYANALKKVKEAISIDPDELIFYRNLQMIYASSGTPEKFEDDYRHMLAEGFPKRAKAYGLILAQQLRQKSFKLYVDGKIDEAIKAMKEMLILYRDVNHKSGIVAGLFSLAVLYEEQGKVDLALEKYREILKINPQHIQAREKLRTFGPGKD